MLKLNMLFTDEDELNKLRQDVEMSLLGSMSFVNGDISVSPVVVDEKVNNSGHRLYSFNVSIGDRAATDLDISINSMSVDTYKLQDD